MSDRLPLLYKTYELLDMIGPIRGTQLQPKSLQPITDFVVVCTELTPPPCIDSALGINLCTESDTP